MKPAPLHTLLSVGILLLASTALHAAPLKVFILAGQSNMQGYAKFSTVDYIKQRPESLRLHELMTSPEGGPVSCRRTWISYFSEERNGKSLIKEGRLTAGFGANQECIGPEYTFGITMEQAFDGPILIIKTAWSGKSMHTDFRPPSAGMPEPGTKNHTSSPSHYYHLMIAHIRRVLDDPGKICPDYNEADGYELSGFVWFQGWNDMTDIGRYPRRNTPGGYDAYTKLQGHLIRDIRRELESPNLPFVIGVLGVGGKLDLERPGQHTMIHHYFRQAMAATANTDEFRGNVVNVLTEECWDDLQGAANDKRGEIENHLKRIEQEKGRIPYKERQAMFMDMFTKEASPEMVAAYQGISNAEYHYLGSARIIGCIGKKFADALIPLVK